MSAVVRGAHYQWSVPGARSGHQRKRAQRARRGRKCAETLQVSSNQRREIRDLGRDASHWFIPHTPQEFWFPRIQFEFPHKQSALVMMIVDRKALMMHLTEMNSLICAKNARDCGYHHRPNLGLLKVPKKNTIWFSLSAVWFSLPRFPSNFLLFNNHLHDSILWWEDGDVDNYMRRCNFPLNQMIWPVL